jgi:hypothetical protein
MRSYVVVVICVGAQYSAKMGLAEDNDVVQAFPANRPNQSFGKPVLPRRERCDGSVPNAHCAYSPLLKPAIWTETSDTARRRKSARRWSAEPAPAVGL